MELSNPSSTTSITVAIKANPKPPLSQSGKSSPLNFAASCEIDSLSKIVKVPAAPLSASPPPPPPPISPTKNLSNSSRKVSPVPVPTAASAAALSQPTTFAFDYCYDGTEDLAHLPGPFEDIVHPLVDKFLLEGGGGTNACVMAYGQTGSGKTFTMFGPQVAVSNTASRKVKTGKKAAAAATASATNSPQPSSNAVGLVPCVISSVLTALQANSSSEEFAANSAVEGSDVAKCLFTATNRGYTSRPSQQRDEVLLNLSVVEIYLEQANCLLSSFDDDAHQGKVEIVENPSTVGIKGRVPSCIAKGAKAIDISKMCPHEALALVNDAMRHRHSRSTAQNARSSRSHIVVTLELVRRTWTSETEAEERICNFRLVDLAGNEKFDYNPNTDQLQHREARSINKSLSALNKVIQEVSKRTTTTSLGGEGITSPLTGRGRSRSLGGVTSPLRPSSSGNNALAFSFRESLLTRLLQDCLAGNSATTAIIATILPTNVKDSLNTLRYADTMRHITTQSQPSAVIQIVKSPPPKKKAPSVTDSPSPAAASAAKKKVPSASKRKPSGGLQEPTADTNRKQQQQSRRNHPPRSSGGSLLATATGRCSYRPTSPVPGLAASGSSFSGDGLQDGASSSGNPYPFDSRIPSQTAFSTFVSELTFQTNSAKSSTGTVPDTARTTASPQMVAHTQIGYPSSSPDQTHTAGEAFQRTNHGDHRLAQRFPTPAEERENLQPGRRSALSPISNKNSLCSPLRGTKMNDDASQHHHVVDAGNTATDAAAGSGGAVFSGSFDDTIRSLGAFSFGDPCPTSELHDSLGSGGEAGSKHQQQQHTKFDPLRPIVRSNDEIVLSLGGKRLDGASINHTSTSTASPSQLAENSCRLAEMDVRFFQQDEMAHNSPTSSFSPMRKQSSSLLLEKAAAGFDSCTSTGNADGRSTSKLVAAVQRKMQESLAEQGVEEVPSLPNDKPMTSSCSSRTGVQHVKALDLSDCIPKSVEVSFTTTHQDDSPLHPPQDHHQEDHATTAETTPSCAPLSTMTTSNTNNNISAFASPRPNIPSFHQSIHSPPRSTTTKKHHHRGGGGAVRCESFSSTALNTARSTHQMAILQESPSTLEDASKLQMLIESDKLVDEWRNKYETEHDLRCKVEGELSDLEDKYTMLENHYEMEQKQWRREFEKINCEKAEAVAAALEATSRPTEFHPTILCAGCQKEHNSTRRSTSNSSSSAGSSAETLELIKMLVMKNDEQQKEFASFRTAVMEKLDMNNPAVVNNTNVTGTGGRVVAGGGFASPHAHPPSLPKAPETPTAASTPTFSNTCTSSITDDAACATNSTVTQCTGTQATTSASMPRQGTPGGVQRKKKPSVLSPTDKPEFCIVTTSPASFEDCFAVSEAGVGTSPSATFAMTTSAELNNSLSLAAATTTTTSSSSSGGAVLLASPPKAATSNKVSAAMTSTPASKIINSSSTGEWLENTTPCEIKNRAALREEAEALARDIAKMKAELATLNGQGRGRGGLKEDPTVTERRANLQASLKAAEARRQEVATERRQIESALQGKARALKTTAALKLQVAKLEQENEQKAQDIALLRAGFNSGGDSAGEADPLLSQFGGAVPSVVGQPPAWVKEICGVTPTSFNDDGSAGDEINTSATGSSSSSARPSARNSIDLTPLLRVLQTPGGGAVPVHDAAMVKQRDRVLQLVMRDLGTLMSRLKVQLLMMNRSAWSEMEPLVCKAAKKPKVLFREAMLTLHTVVNEQAKASGYSASGGDRTALAGCGPLSARGASAKIASNGEKLQREVSRWPLTRSDCQRLPPHQRSHISQCCRMLLVWYDQWNSERQEELILSILELVVNSDLLCAMAFASIEVPQPRPLVLHNGLGSASATNSNHLCGDGGNSSSGHTTFYRRTTSGHAGSPSRYAQQQVAMAATSPNNSIDGDFAVEQFRRIASQNHQAVNSWSTAGGGGEISVPSSTPNTGRSRFERRNSALKGSSGLSTPHQSALEQQHQPPTSRAASPPSSKALPKQSFTSSTVNSQEDLTSFTTTSQQPQQQQHSSPLKSTRSARKVSISIPEEEEEGLMMMMMNGGVGTAAGPSDSKKKNSHHQLLPQKSDCASPLRNKFELDFSIPSE